MIIGYVIGQATTQEALILAERPVRLGTYVVLEYDNVKALGLITNVTRGSPMLDDNMNDIEIVQRLKQFNNSIPVYIKAKVKMLCDMNNHFLMPDIPPFAGTPAREAEDEELKSIYSQDGQIRIGSLT